MLIGCFQFFHEASGKYLNALDEDIVLYHKKERTSYFHVYQKHNNIMALQSVMTRKFLGVTWLGEVRVAGEYFGKSEECHLQMEKNETGLYLLACNWWIGGWLKIPGEDDIGKISKCSSGLTDVTDIIKFNITKIDTKGIQ